MIKVIPNGISGFAIACTWKNPFAPPKNPKLSKKPNKIKKVEETFK